VLAIDPHVTGVSDDPARSAGLGNQREAIGIVDVDRKRGRPLEIGKAEEPKADRLARDPWRKALIAG
jgi:hypothetical protein